MATRMQQRRGTAAQWISTNDGDGPILAIGEIGYESDTNKFKIGDGVNHWVDLAYFVDLETMIAGAPGLLNSLDEIAAAIGDDPAFFTSIATGLSSKAPIASPTFTGTVSGITKGMVNLGNVDNTSDADKPVSTATQTALDAKLASATAASTYAPLASPTFTGEVTLPDNTIQQRHLGDDSVGTNELGGLSVTTGKIADDAVTSAKIAAGAVNTSEIADSSITTAKIADGAVTSAKFAAGALTELAQDAVNDALVAGNGISKSYDDAGNTITLSVDGSAFQARVANVSDTEIGYLDGVSSSIQTQIDDKAPLASPTFTGTVAGITKAMVGLGNVDNTNDANKQISTAAQAALDLKAPLASPNFTGTVSGITKAMIGLSEVDNSSDLNKGISTAQQAALDLKANLAGPTLTGTTTAANLTVSNNLVVSGDLTVSGTTTTVNTTNFTTSDPVIYLGEGNNANLVDMGFVGSYNDGTYAHQGLVKDSSMGKWKLFKGITDEPTTTVNFAQGELDALAVGPLEATSLTVGTVSNTEIGYLDGVTSAIQTQIDAKLASATAESTYAPINGPTFTGTVSGITKSMVGLGNVDNTSDANKGISTAAQTALDLKAPLASPTFTGTVTLPTGTVTSGMILDGTIVDADVNASAAIAWTKIAPSSTVSATELGYLDGVTSAIQTQIDSKISSADAASTYQPKITGVSDTEISYLDGVTTSIQTQLDAKAPIASPTFTGTVSGVTKSMVGLGNADNTSDALKPISDATATALALKAPLASPTFTGTVTLPTGTVTSGMILDGTIVNGDIASAAAIDQSKISGLTTDLGLKAALASPALTGTPTAPLAATGTNTTQIATTSFVQQEINILTTGAPAAMNTLDELAAALGDDANYAATITTALGTKAPLASPTFTGTVTAPAITATALITASASGVAFTDGTQTKAGVPSLTTTTTTISGAYNLSTGGLALRDQLVNIAGAFAVTVPTNTTTAFPVGTSISFWQSSGAGGASFVAADGTVTIYAAPGTTLRALYSSATLTKVATNAWLLSGDIKA